MKRLLWCSSSYKIGVWNAYFTLSMVNHQFPFRYGKSLVLSNIGHSSVLRDDSAWTGLPQLSDLKSFNVILSDLDFSFWAAQLKCLRHRSMQPTRQKFKDNRFIGQNSFKKCEKFYLACYVILHLWFHYFWVLLTFFISGFCFSNLGLIIEYLVIKL